MPSLAARCTACGTVFRVVQDQLRVAGGLVRCGRCGEVFNAAEALIDLDTAAPVSPRSEPQADHGPELQPPSQPPAPLPLPPLPMAPSPMAPLPPAPADLPASAAPIEPPPPASAEPEPFTATAIEPAPADWRSLDGPPLFADEPTEPPAAGAEPGPQAADPRAEPDDQPSFVRRAERAQRWRQPPVRAALGTAALLGAVALAAQVAHSWRDQVAASYPGARPTLDAACAVIGCKVEAVRAIDKLAVESSGLVRVEKSSVYRLQLTLRNRSDIALALPAFDLTLSDAAGKPLARRVLRGADLGVNDTTLAAGRELGLQATLQAATEPVVGYTIELFYP
jgi:predicted Zn finger-like uncharacterized protein